MRNAFFPPCRCILLIPDAAVRKKCREGLHSLELHERRWKRIVPTYFISLMFAMLARSWLLRVFTNITSQNLLDVSRVQTNFVVKDSKIFLHFPRLLHTLKLIIHALETNFSPFEINEVLKQQLFGNVTYMSRSFALNIRSLRKTIQRSFHVTVNRNICSHNRYRVPRLDCKFLCEFNFYEYE